MLPFVGSPRLAVIPIVLIAAVSALQAQAPSNVVSLKVSREAAPPGAIAQVKVFVTEPKPITSGRALMSFDAFSDIEGIALAAGDAAGIAVVHGGQIALSVVSPSATFGMVSDYPVLTVAGRVPATAPLGMRIPMQIDPAALRLLNPSGELYVTEVKDGYLLSGGVLSISDVIPGSADVAAGGTVSIFGTGFRPDTRVRLKETALSAVRYVNPNRIDVIVAEPTHMHGKGIRVRNRDGAEVTYFAYQRTRRSGTTADARLQNVVPIFPDASSDQHVIDVSKATAGIALQNLAATATFVIAELADANGLGQSSRIDVASNTYVVRSLAEIFGFSPDGGAVVTLLGVTPVQALGVNVDSRGRATPQLPR
jgi:hypothetical protein